MEPFFSNDAVTFGVLLTVLGLIFYTSHSDNPAWKKFYKFVPALLLCYFIPAILHYPLGLIAAHWYPDGSLDAVLAQYNLVLPKGLSYDAINAFLDDNGVPADAYTGLQQHSKLYYVASRYMLPASLILLCLGIDFQGLKNLGFKSIIMFFAATLGIMLGGPIALLIILNVAPGIVDANPDELWRGLSTVAGSWIGGGANQTAMKEIFLVSDRIFSTMIVVDVVVANMWMGFLLYGANVSAKIDNWFKADASAIDDLVKRVSSYRASIAKIPTTTDLFILGAVAFGGVAIAHFGADILTPFFKGFSETLSSLRLDSLMSHFFWLIVISTTIGLGLSFTKARGLEGSGASNWGSVFIYILVATIGMKMNIGDILSNLGLFAIGIIWMIVHVFILLLTAKLIKAPFFFVAVGSQANVGGAASAPVVAAAFNPALAPVGVLMAVLGYAVGTYGAIICAIMMQAVAGG